MAACGRPVPSKLEIEVAGRFKRNDSMNMEVTRNRYPHLEKPNPPVGAPGKGGVNWVGLNPDPCKAKYLAKQGGGGPTVVTAPMRPRNGRSASGAGSELGDAQEDGTSRPPGSAVGSAFGDDGPRLLRSPSAPATANASLPGTAKTATTKTRRSLSSVLTTKSVQDAVQKEVRRQLNKMSTHGHFLDQRYHVGGEFGSRAVEETKDLKELVYYGVSHEGEGKKAYLKNRSLIMPQDRFYQPHTSAAEVGWGSYVGPNVFVGKQLERMQGKPSTLVIA
eukprot:TRINITY_DN21108_c0_g2_i1.p2 TRINITY_DN21108_c0_g2~~TRINITY_DN21108_c0_g2_i1.p2  ORF type:complete len:277 (+),score=57.52 TRINITY_DN21108_c0_g2_i1:143-973(+)